MPRITIYTTMLCGYCARAKRLLADKGVAFEEIDVTFKPDERERLRRYTGGRSTVPQIFVGERHIGGCDELYALEAKGELDAFLTG